MYADSVDKMFDDVLSGNLSLIKEIEANHLADDPITNSFRYPTEPQRLSRKRQSVQHASIVTPPHQGMLTRTMTQHIKRLKTNNKQGQEILKVTNTTGEQVGSCLALVTTLKGNQDQYATQMSTALTHIENTDTNVGLVMTRVEQIGSDLGVLKARTEQAGIQLESAIMLIKNMDSVYEKREATLVNRYNQEKYALKATHIQEKVEMKTSYERGYGRKITVSQVIKDIKPTWKSNENDLLKIGELAAKEYTKIMGYGPPKETRTYPSGNKEICIYYKKDWLLVEKAARQHLKL